MQAILDVLSIRFNTIKVEDARDGMLTILVDKADLLPIFNHLYNDPALGFQFLTDLCGIHDTESSPPRLGVIYHLHNLLTNMRLRVKTFTPVEIPTIPSVCSLFAAANWMERETYDFFGIQFEGHPDLRRILNVDDMDYFPLRKEYPLEDTTREDKQDAYFGR
jgi:NADH-quinone oxidoreductase subunit C